MRQHVSAKHEVTWSIKLQEGKNQSNSIVCLLNDNWHMSTASHTESGSFR